MALVVGSILGLASIGSLAAGGTALWADLTRRDAAGYVTTGTHPFSTAGSALSTEPAELDPAGVGWLYSSMLLGDVRIRVTPANGDAPVFVGIAPSKDVDRYLAGTSHTVISDFWSEQVRSVSGDTPSAAPGTQDFWVASTSGTGVQTLTWDASDGSWTVVVMDADGRPGIDVSTQLAATFPALFPIAVVSLVLGATFAIAGIALVIGAIRRIRGVTTVREIS